MSNHKKNILFVCPYPYDEAPSQRFRFEQYLPYLKKQGYGYKQSTFYSETAWKNLYKEGKTAFKVLAVLSGFLRRKLLLFTLWKYDFVFIHREATPLGPPFFEWIVAHIWRKKIIYDFDDAIWLADPSEEGSFKSIIKWKSKVRKICKWSHRVSCGNEYLAEFARQYNTEVIVNPTTIDTNYHVAKANTRNKDLLTVGWTGTHSTLPYLQHIVPSLIEAYREQAFRLVVIANKPPNFKFPELDFIEWSKKSEVEDLQKIDIGLMPLSEDLWSEGKCGFKALQYMGIGIPVLGSPVGVNKEIIPNGGFLITEKEDWGMKLKALMQESSLREALGKQGRMYVKKHFSIESNLNNFLYLFRS